MRPTSCACRCRDRPRSLPPGSSLSFDRYGSGAGCCASCGCCAPAYTLSLRSCARPSLLRGSMPRTACRMTSSGRRRSIWASVRSRRPPWIAGVAVVDLLLQLVAGDADALAVDDHDEVAGVDVRRVRRLELAAQRVGDARRETAERLAVGVDHVPAALDLAGLGAIGRLLRHKKRGRRCGPRTCRGKPAPVRPAGRVARTRRRGNQSSGRPSAATICARPVS